MRRILTGIAVVTLFASISFTTVTFATEPAPAAAPQQKFVDVEFSNILGHKVKGKILLDDLNAQGIKPGDTLTLVALPQEK